MERMYVKYVPLNLSEMGRRAAIQAHLQAAVEEGCLTDEEAAVEFDAAIRVMKEDWSNSELPTATTERRHRVRV
jgi:hypothetical protein